MRIRIDLMKAVEEAMGNFLRPMRKDKTLGDDDSGWYKLNSKRWNR